MKRKVQQPVAAQGELVKYDQQGMRTRPSGSRKSRWRSSLDVLRRT